KGAGLPLADANQILEFVSAGRASRSGTLTRLERILSGSAGVDELKQIDAVLSALGVGDDQAAFDTSIVRGLEYYTGAVFEAQLISDGASFGSVGGGGRYDDLVSRFRGEKIPATGFSIGVSRLAATLQANAATSEEAGPVIVLIMDQSRAV